MMTELFLRLVPGVQDTPAAPDAPQGSGNDQKSVWGGGLPGGEWGDEGRLCAGHTLRSGVVSLEHWLDLNA
jgi:hypothetical protein